MHKAQILVIDDEAPIRKLLEITLETDGYRVILAANAKEGTATAALSQPDLIILDLGLPDKDGQQVLRELREWYTRPIVILSVRNTETDIITALDHGANDYLNKPFRSGELLARIRSALRLNRDEATESPVYRIADLTVDLGSHTVRKGTDLLRLTSTEFALLALLVRNRGKVLTHAFILREIWGPGYIERTEYPRVFVGQLRKKIETNPNQPALIFTESGIGYRFADE
jgi:two-component system KDP operon response regulator KdpE